MTYTLDLVGFSIVFPVLAPLLLNPKLHFFLEGTEVGTRTTILGVVFAIFGISQLIGAPIAGALADVYGRYKLFLWTIGISIIGYGIMAYSIYEQSLIYLFIGRIVTGLSSGNLGLAQSAAADLTEPEHRSKAFGILIGIGSLGFTVGPFIGGKLANPEWLFGSGAFIFAGIAALVNFLMVLFFFVEVWQRKEEHKKASPFAAIKDISFVFQHRVMRNLLVTQTLFAVGWAFFLIFSPTFLVQRFSLGSSMIGDIFAYMSLIWLVASIFLNKMLTGKFKMRPLISFSALLAAAGIMLYILPNTLWPYWIIIPIALTGGAMCWVNLNSLLSMRASESMQGRVMGACGATWSIGQIVAPLIAGPLAGWNIYSPLFVGALLIMLCFVYFLFSYQKS